MCMFFSALRVPQLASPSPDFHVARVLQEQRLPTLALLPPHFLLLPRQLVLLLSCYAPSQWIKVDKLVHNSSRLNLLNLSADGNEEFVDLQPPIIFQIES